ncbi:uncharacterized protein METZ01_LOCUS432522 [marine metagenome]|uniref:Uncharacterized protein n=1 Tax=marine metagenome TaxID=408172 RepID=A0A382YAX3_9ZZZZ
MKLTFVIILKVTNKLIFHLFKGKYLTDYLMEY